MIRTWFHYGGPEFSCHGWLPIWCAYKTNRHERLRPWPSNGCPWAEIVHTCPCRLLPEGKHILCGPGWDLCWTSVDSLRLPDAYLCPAAFVFFIVTNFSHEHNLLSLVSPPSKITKLGWLWEYQNRGMYDWIGGWESTASIKNPLLTVWCKCLLTFSYAYTNTYSYCYQNSYYNHTYQLLYFRNLSIPVHTDLSPCLCVKFKVRSFLVTAAQYFKHTIMCLTNFLWTNIWVARLSLIFQSCKYCYCKILVHMWVSSSVG